MMRPDIKQEWVRRVRTEPLASGSLQFIAFDGRTYTDPLGILCDIYARENPPACFRHYPGFPRDHKPDPDKSSIEKICAFLVADDDPDCNPVLYNYWVLPPEVEKWAGLDDANVQVDLAWMNDETEASADEIADFIDRQFA